MIHEFAPLERLDQLILTITLMIVYGIFLAYRAFRRKERLEYLAYVTAIIPFAYMWALGLDTIIAMFFLLLLWTIALVRDLIAYIREKLKSGKSDFANGTLMYLIGVGAYVLTAIILPLVPMFDMPARPDVHYLFMAFPVLVDMTNLFLVPFKLLATLNLAFIIIPLIVDIKTAAVPVKFAGNILLAVLFALPTILVVYLWLVVPGFQAGLMWVIGLLIGILYLVLLLLITRGKK